MNNRCLRILPLIAALGSFSAPALSESIEESCRQGASEPRLVWYSSQDPSRNTATVEAFSKAYPAIKIEMFRLTTGALAARYASERTGGVINADLISVGDPNFINAGFDKGWFVKFEKPDLPAVAKLDDKWFERGAAVTGNSILGISYNTDLVGSRPPKTWEDLLRPEFKGKITLGDPRNVPSYMALYRILKDELGPDYLKALAAQQPVLFESGVPGTQKMAAGEFAIAFPNSLSVVSPLKAQGAPVEFVVPALTTGNEYITMISEGADSPKAAKCFYNFLFTDAGQKAYTGTIAVSPFPHLAGATAMPAQYKDPKITELPKHAKDILELLKIQ